MTRVVTVRVGWLALAGVLLLVALLALASRRPTVPAVVGVDPAQVRAACAQYAHLDLSGWAAVCAGAGYQDRVYVEPTGVVTYWPRVYRTVDGVARVVQPEDLDRR